MVKDFNFTRKVELGEWRIYKMTYESVVRLLEIREILVSNLVILSILSTLTSLNLI